MSLPRQHYRVRSDSTEKWAAVNPVLALGECGYDFDLNIMKIGDGVKTWSALEKLEKRDYIHA